MKAIAINNYGSVDEFHEIELPVPTLAPDEVLVKVKATSVNPIDWKARLGYLQKMYPWHFPIVLGWDVAGTITKVGSAVHDFKVGDDVFARPDIYNEGQYGTYAEFTKVKQDKLALKPSRLSFQEAAAVPLAGLTAWQVIVDRLQVKKGDKVLIQAGTGGVGLFAIQIAKHLGAVVATTASARNADWLRKLGADTVIDYHTQDYTQLLTDYDAVFDTTDDIANGLKILKPEGRLVTIAGHPADSQKTAKPSAEAWWLQPNGNQLAELGQLINDGVVKVIIDSTFPLSVQGVRDGQQKSEGNHARGKIVIVATDN
ncbi:NADP-dependent oxidoreductase [uncultured Secundilactobacillus sp.]|uniref:NADP-dependent oxidoreductase n=1 Tax=uncultured Secundilactobacillus sp. TaxID=2813935 RepID=UPI0025952904|nr:NADP-dependent oxidoreductase [uncultured Secundilactobacillus sp.]